MTVGPRRRGELVAGRFELIELIGEGGAGEVWRATQTNLGREVALKLLGDKYARSPEARARFEREAKVAAALTHPNAVRIHDFGEAEGVFFLAMELLEGATLRSFVDEDLPLLPLPRAVRIAASVADVLAAAHDIELVHRDIKPENIFIEQTSKGGDRVVVVDFGLAFIEGSEDRGRMTREGLITGTPHYMAPEQISGAQVGTRADVYSLGCVLYEMLTSTAPFGGNAQKMLYAHLFSPPRPPREVRRDPDLPIELDELTMRMLSKLPEERPDMETVRGVLESFDPREGSQRGERYLVGRAARMVPIPEERRNHNQPTEASQPPSPLMAEAVEVAVIGELEGDLVLGLGANGLLPYVVTDHQIAPEARAIFAPAQSIAELKALREEHAIPVITTADPSDMDRIAELVHVGVDEVITRPLSADKTARQIWRAIRRHARRREK